ECAAVPWQSQRHASSSHHTAGIAHAVLVQLRGGNATLALENSRQLVASFPEEAAGYNLVGAIELSNGDEDSARSNFLTSLEKDPQNPVAQRFLAQIAESSGDLEEAAKRYESIVDADSSATWAMYGRARVAATAEQLDLAAEWLSRILPLEPNSVVPRETLARVHAQSGDFESAMRVASNLVALDRTRAQSHVLLGDIAARSEDFETAISAYDDARRLEPENAQIMLRLAEARRLSGDSDAALATLSDEGIDYSDLRTASATALAFSNAGDDERAMDIAKRLEREHPDSAAPIALKGELWLRMSDLEEAVAAYEAAFNKEMNRTYAARLHQLRRELGDADADEPLRRYLATSPDDPSMQLLLAQHMNQSGDDQSSIAVYEDIVAANPEDGVALNNLAWLYYTQRDDRAIPTARKAREALPTNWSVLDTLGWVLVEAGELDEGIEVLAEAAEISDGVAVVRYHLAEAYARSGRRDEARSILEELLADGAADFDGRSDAERLLAEL
ncbi:MAG: tetratricopeptide repeat protein, partial [Pseudomonadota bacterium]